jgi:anti-sigma B factor antagonist
MDVTVSTMMGKAAVTVFQVNGHVDAANVGELEDRATEAVNAGATNVLLDMGEVSFMSSAGFRSLHKIYQALHPEGGSGHLKILNPSDEIGRLVKTLGFDNFVTILSGDLQQAVDSF